MPQIDFKLAFDLLTKIVSDKKEGELEEALEPLRKFIAQKLPSELEENAPHDFPDLIFDMQYYFERFKDNILFSPLIGKNVVALGGAFSSGKSSFLNALFGERILPAKIEPTTSVPTYVVKSDNAKALAVNVFNSRINLALDDIKIISHGFSADYDVKLGHLLRTLFVEFPAHPFKKIAFLDTPGYSNPEDEYYTEKTDEKIARSQLNSSNFILWFVSVEGGTITENDLNFLKTLDKTIPKAVIISKADKRLEKDVEAVTEGIREMLLKKGIAVEDVIPFSARRPEEFGKKQITALLKKWSEQIFISTFGRDFMKLFVEMKDFYEELIFDETKRLGWINKAAMFVDDADEEVTETFEKLKEEIQFNLRKYKELLEKLKELQKEFFAELEKIAEKFGVEIDVPSEVDTYENKIGELIPLIRKIKKKQNVKPNNFEAILNNKFNGVKIGITKAMGNKDYSLHSSKKISAAFDEKLKRFASGNVFIGAKVALLKRKMTTPKKETDRKELLVSLFKNNGKSKHKI